MEFVIGMAGTGKTCNAAKSIGKAVVVSDNVEAKDIRRDIMTFEEFVIYIANQIGVDADIDVKAVDQAINTARTGHITSLSKTEFARYVEMFETSSYTADWIAPHVKRYKDALAGKRDFAAVLKDVNKALENKQTAERVAREIGRVVIDGFEDIHRERFKTLLLLKAAYDPFEVDAFYNDDTSIFMPIGTFGSFTAFAKAFKPRMRMMTQNFRIGEPLITVATKFARQNRFSSTKTYEPDNTSTHITLIDDKFDLQIPSGTIAVLGRTEEMAQELASEIGIQCVSFKDRKIPRNVAQFIQFAMKPTKSALASYLVTADGFGDKTINQILTSKTEINSLDVDVNKLVKAGVQRSKLREVFDTAQQFVKAVSAKDEKATAEILATLCDPKTARVVAQQVIAQNGTLDRSQFNVADSIHNVKGAEFDIVIIGYVKAGKFPYMSAMIEEERRIMYTALTRAKKHVFVVGNASSILYRELERMTQP